MAKKKKSIERMLQELVTDGIEIELHKRLRKIRKAVVAQRKKSTNQLQEIRLLPEPNSDVIEAEEVPVTEEESLEEEQTDRGE